MMRSPKAMAIAVRRPDGSIAVREERWRCIAEKLPFFRWPILRGSVVLVEALINGIQALNFSAKESIVGLEASAAKTSANDISDWALAFTVFFSLALGVFLFLIVPHIISGIFLKLWGISGGIRSFAFHAVDGLIKISIFIIYILVIGRIADIKRIFQYHGAEHKAIFTYEAGEELLVANARGHSTLHPRCGTAFIIIVLLISIGVFAIVIPFIPFHGPKWLVTMQIIFTKMFLMAPIAGLSYEIIRLANKGMLGYLAAPFIYPGLLMQTLTTSNPADDQLEVAIEALKRALKIEEGARD
ncbi:MAG: DUF1385 domain-containing protein [Desulfobacteraceae bacterium]|nr:DUF1385 domain-containing protein [Desulfobacteraceae bacterium]